MSNLTIGWKFQFVEFKEVIKKKYKDHYKEFNEYIIRDFCDALILAKNEALNEDKESKSYLTDDNLTFVILDLFMGKSSFNMNFKFLLF